MATLCTYQIAATACKGEQHNNIWTLIRNLKEREEEERSEIARVEQHHVSNKQGTATS